MKDNKLNTLDNITELFPKDFTEEQIAKAKTLFYKQFSLKLHQYYGAKCRLFQWRLYMVLIGSTFGTLQEFLRFPLPFATITMLRLV